ncbi:cyclic nucleotide-gated ion channel [Salix suchowensis]|nr:cyclic nucleotide-gated ion channel [Salix suchowensis]
MDETSSTPLKFKRIWVDEEPILHAYLQIFVKASSVTNNWTLLDEFFFFLQMDDQLFDAICGLLVSLLKYSRKLYSLRRFYRDAFYYQGKTRELNSKWRVNSFLQLNYFETWTVRALEEVEAFTLRAEDLKFVTNQFRRLHSKKLRLHTFRFHSDLFLNLGCLLYSGSVASTQEEDDSKEPEHVRAILSFCR